MTNNGLDIIQGWIDILFKKCSSWVQTVGEDSFLVDPIEGVEISAHYGATHSAAAFILLGRHRGEDRLYRKGIKLLISILDRWEKSIKLPSFHFDFNNFALCIIEETLSSEKDLVARIRRVVLETSDSKHDTINWLPMRAFVNLKRFEWTMDSKYRDVYDTCMLKIKDATNPDGGIEDRLPKGTSFNLQYDIATVSVLQLLRVSGVDIDLSRELGFLLNSVAPDGDINYQGRGTNQVFAWSCWLYLLSSSGQDVALREALSFLVGKLEKMLSRDNIFLNEESGHEKHLWWDYHYASVYIAHLFFWLVLAIRDYNKAAIVPTFNLDGSTGLIVYKGKDYFVTVFNGRKEYLAEKGPSVVALWTKKVGMIFKGSFGPWQGLFGNNHCSPDSVLNNYWGAIMLKQNKNPYKYRVVRRVLQNLSFRASMYYSPHLSPVTIIKDLPRYIGIEYIIPKGHVLNLPVFLSTGFKPSVFSGEKSIPVSKDLLILNQYGILTVYRTIIDKNEHIVVKIPL